MVKRCTRLRTCVHLGDASNTARRNILKSMLDFGGSRPVDQMTQFEICFTKLRTLPIDHSQRLSLVKYDISEMQIVVEKFGSPLKIQRGNGCLQKPICSLE